MEVITLFDHRGDALNNPYTGMGDRDYDARLATGINIERIYQRRELEEYHKQYWACRRVTDTIPDQATREWGTFTLGRDGDAEVVSGISAYLNRLGVRQLFAEAQKTANIQGGAALVMLIDDGEHDYSQPVNLNRIRSIQSLAILDSEEIYPDTGVTGWSLRPRQPDQYFLNIGSREMGGSRIHSSRVLRFDGAYTPHQSLRENRGWSYSILQSFINALLSYEGTLAAVERVLQDFDVYVHSIKGLYGKLTAPGNDGAKAQQVLTDRLKLNQRGRSTYRGMALDMDAEKAEFISRNLTGVPQAQELYKNNLIAASDLPPAILFGLFPSGLGATGESERRTWADRIRTFQTDRFTPCLQALIPLILLAQDGPTKGQLLEDWSWDWHSLFQLTTQEEAAHRKTVAETDQINIAAGIYTSQEARNSHYGGAKFDINITLDEANQDRHDAAHEEYVRYPLVRLPQFPGLEIGLSHRPGDVRRGHIVQDAYGHIRRHMSPDDGMALDVFLGTDLDSPNLYRVWQLTRTGEFEQCKIMVGYRTMGDAIAAFKRNRPPTLFGGIEPIQITALQEYQVKPKQDNELPPLDDLLSLAEVTPEDLQAIIESGDLPPDVLDFLSASQASKNAPTE